MTVGRSVEHEHFFGPLQELIEDPLCAGIEVFAPDRVVAIRRGQSYPERIAFDHDGAVRDLVERLSGFPSAGRSTMSFELPGDIFARALFPPVTEHVYLKFAKPVPRPERWMSLIDHDILPVEAARFVTEAVRARATIFINGPPSSGRTTMLNVVAGEIPEDERTAIIDDDRELTVRHRPGLVKLPTEFDEEGRERRLLAAALRTNVGRLVMNEVLDREIAGVFAAATSRRLSVLAGVAPVEQDCEPGIVAERLLMLLQLEGVDYEAAIALLRTVAPLVIQTRYAGEADQWRVGRIFSVVPAAGAGFALKDLWQLSPETDQLTRVPQAFTVRVQGATAADVALQIEAEDAAETQRQRTAAQPVQVDPFETTLQGTRLLADWIQPNVPLPIAEPERDCALCPDLARSAANRERTNTGTASALRLARWREALHRGLHGQLSLVLARYAGDPDFPNRLRQPHWDDEDGRPILRDPLRGDPRVSEAFFCYQRFRFGEFSMATMRHLDDRPRLRLYDNRGQVLELSGVASGYRGQGARGTVWVLRMAGFPDELHKGNKLTRLESFVYDEKNRSFSLRWDSKGWSESL